MLQTIFIHHRTAFGRKKKSRAAQLHPCQGGFFLFVILAGEGGKTIIYKPKWARASCGGRAKKGKGKPFIGYVFAFGVFLPRATREVGHSLSWSKGGEEISCVTGEKDQEGFLSYHATAAFFFLTNQEGNPFRWECSEEKRDPA